MIPSRVIRPVAVVSRRKGTSSSSHPKLSLGSRAWRAIALFAVVTAPSPFAAPTITRAFVTGSNYPHRNGRDSLVPGPLQQQQHQQPSAGNHDSSSASSSGRTMASSSRDNNDNDSPTAFSRASQRLESPSAERNKEPIWQVLSSNILPRLRDSNSSSNNNNNNTNEPWTILEIAAGAGVHTEHFASQWLSLAVALSEATLQSDDGAPPPPFVWYPTDPTEDARASIRSRVAEANLGRVVAPAELLTLGAHGIICNDDESAASASTASATAAATAAVEDTALDLVLCINMIHISPWEATLGLMKLAGERLRQQQQHDNNTEGNNEEASSGGGGGYLYCYGPYRHDGKIVPSNENFDRSLKSRNPEWGVRDLKDVIDAAHKEGLELVDCIDMPSNNTSLIFRRRRPP